MNRPSLVIGTHLAMTMTVLARSSNDDLTVRAEEALRKGVWYLRRIAIEGGYPWAYSPDLRERWGEIRMSPTQAWVQPPATPTAGEAFLAAYAVTGDPEAWRGALAAAEALRRGQLESGGWDFKIEFDPVARRRYRYRVDANANNDVPSRRFNVTTLDDDCTPSAIRFLVRLCALARLKRQALPEVEDTLDYALRRLAAAQYPNGAWPQRFEGPPSHPSRHPLKRAQFPKEMPTTCPKEKYYGDYTLNDMLPRDVTRALQMAWRLLGREDCRQAAIRTGEFLIHAQLPPPQPAWAQQYDWNMVPTWARAFEPPAIASAESVGAMQTLLLLYRETGDRRFLEPIPPALKWLDQVRLPSGRWARLYELQTNRPIYGDRDGKIHYSLEELSEERRRGYSWEGEYGLENVRKEFERWRSARWQPPSPPEIVAVPRPPSESELRRIIESQESEGRWLTRGKIEMGPTSEYLRKLAAFLGTRRGYHLGAAVRAPQAPESSD